MAELSVIGVNHRTAGVAVREQLALPGDLPSKLVHALHADREFSESLVLATCNRTECYFVPRGGQDPLAYFLAMIGRLKNAPPVEADPAVFYRYDDMEAVRHLFRVTSALDSQIVGEHQIIGQVKEAYRLAVEARSAGFLLNKLMHRAFLTGKRVQTETELGRGSAGVAQAAVELARQIFKSLEGKTVLLVGAGQMAECAARALLKCGAAHLIVANRTVYRAQQLAVDLVQKPPAVAATCAEEEACPTDLVAGDPPIACPPLLAAAAAAPEDASTDAIIAETSGGGPRPAARPATAEAIGLEGIPAAITRADLVITSTGSPETVLTYEGLADVLRRRTGTILIVDIAVPRDVDERLAQLDNVFLYNMDNLNRLVAMNIERRRQEIPRAEAIVDLEVGEFARWLASREVAPTIRQLQEYLAGLQQAQIERYGKKFAERDELARFAQGLVGQVLHKPLALLKELSADGSVSDRLATVDMLRKLFDLDKKE